MGTPRLFVPAGLVIFCAVAGCSATTAGPSGNGCTPDSNVSNCTAMGYSCSGANAPDKDMASLACNAGVMGNGGSTDYCCLSGFAFSPSTCGADHAVPGCSADSYGFSCAGTNTPDQIDSSLSCSSSGAGSGGSTRFCCTAGASTGPVAPCTKDPAF